MVCSRRLCLLVCGSTKELDSVCNNTNLGRMVGNNTKARSPLLPDRMQQGDFFVCDIFDAAPKGDMASMEHPVFSISTKPDKNIRRYENGDVFVEIVPSVKGLATVYDRDILIFCISQVIASLFFHVFPFLFKLQVSLIFLLVLFLRQVNHGFYIVFLK